MRRMSRRTIAMSAAIAAEVNLIDFFMMLYSFEISFVLAAVSLPFTLKDSIEIVRSHLFEKIYLIFSIISFSAFSEIPELTETE